MFDQSGATTQLAEGVVEMGVPVSDEQRSRCLHFLSLLQKWNKAYNLTAIRRVDEMVTKHLLDSLSVVPYVEGGRVLDVGAGGGLPGIPLAIAMPTKHFTLLDSNAKKTRFLQQVCYECGLENVSVEHCRVENFEPYELFDIVLCRAFASISEFVECTRHLGSRDALWLAMKGACSEEEIGSMPADFYVKKSVALNVAGLEAQRSLLILQKSS